MARQKRKKGRRRRKREPLVHAYLERVSRELLEKHPEIVREFIGRNAGVYALYRKNRLYYVGLATKLSWRLKVHSRNRHGGSWDRFSIYLTIRDQHLREIESLILQIAKPPGNKIGGKPFGAKDMRRWIRSGIRQKHKIEDDSLFGRQRKQKTTGKRLSKHSEKSKILRLLPNGARLRGSNKGTIYRAVVRRDGQIRYDGNNYTSLSNAAVAAIKRPINGWWFWQVERGRGNWVRLTKIRKTGTPLYSR